MKTKERLEHGVFGITGTREEVLEAAATLRGAGAEGVFSVLYARDILLCVVPMEVMRTHPLVNAIVEAWASGPACSRRTVWD